RARQRLSGRPGPWRPAAPGVNPATRRCATPRNDRPARQSRSNGANPLSSTLVTGATGFTGSHLCRRLVADGHHVIALVRPTSRTRELEEMGVECRVADICDRAALRSVFPRVDVVYHL